MSGSLLYVILGTVNSGRRALVNDLIEGGLSQEDRPLLLLSEKERPDPEDESRCSPTTAIRQWNWHRQEKDPLCGCITAEVGPEYNHVFFITDGRMNPVDQLEALRPWIQDKGLVLARIIAVVNCALALRHGALLPWYDACVHFADYVLLNKREGVANKWISDFLNRYKAQHYPCLFEQVKNNRVRNPALVLLPQARRISLFFDADESPLANLDADTVIETEDGESMPAEDEDTDLLGQKDPYIVRIAPGKRAREIPEITRYLDDR